MLLRLSNEGGKLAVECRAGELSHACSFLLAVGVRSRELNRPDEFLTKSSERRIRASLSVAICEGFATDCAGNAIQRSESATIWR